MIDVKNENKLYPFVVFWAIYTALHVFCVSFAMPSIAIFDVIIHSFIRSVLLGVLVLLIEFILAFANYKSLQAIQIYVNIFSLYILTLVAWLGFGYIADSVFLDDVVKNSFLGLYPFYGLIGTFVFLIILLQQQLKNDSKVEEEMSFSNDEDLNSSLPIGKEQEIIERIAVKSGTKIHVILIEEIVFLQADGDYVQIHTQEGKYLKEQTMKYFQERLPANKFVRVHRSAIVNVEHISRIELFEKQSQLLTLKNGEQIKMSIAGYKTLKEVLGL